MKNEKYQHPKTDPFYSGEGKDLVFNEAGYNAAVSNYYDNIEKMFHEMYKALETIKDAFWSEGSDYSGHKSDDLKSIATEILKQIDK